MKQIEFGSPEAVKILEHDRKQEKNAERIEELEAEIKEQQSYIADLILQRDDMSMDIDDEDALLQVLKRDLRALI